MFQCIIDLNLNRVYMVQIRCGFKLAPQQKKLKNNVGLRKRFRL